MMPLMHDDATAILRSYTEEALAKSRKENRKKGSKKQPDQEDDTALAEKSRTNPDNAMLLHDCSEEELTRELARRRAEKFRLAGASPQDKRGLLVDPTGQVCSLNGGDGSIPCQEL